MFSRKDVIQMNELIYLLDMTSLKKICDNLKIDYNTYIKTDDGLKKTGETNHKEFIINDILFYIKNDDIPPKTIYNKNIQCNDKTDDLTPSNKVYYGQYKTTDKNILKLMKNLTNNKFKFGAISQKIIKSYWKKNKLITYKKFAELWCNENDQGDVKYKELAYNQFMKKYGSKDEWKKKKEEAINLFKKCKLL